MKYPDVKTVLIISLLFTVSIALAGCIKNGSDEENNDDIELDFSYTLPSTIKIVHMEGWVNNSTEQMEKLRLLVELHPPGLETNEDIEPIDIEQELSIHISWIDMEPGTDYGIAGVEDLVHQNNTNSNYFLEIFTTEIISDPNNDMAGQGLFSQDCQIFIIIDFSERGGNSWYIIGPSGGGLDPASSGSVKFIFSTGAYPMINSFTVPYFFPKKGGWIDLY